MPVRRRNLKCRAAIDADEAAWLVGDHDCGFVQFKHWDQLEDLWEKHGDTDNFHWHRGMYFPEPIE
jgi:hypothetical protein